MKFLTTLSFVLILICIPLNVWLIYRLSKERKHDDK
nr:MAG TPA: immunity protein [Caudoviricetes sp.]